MNEHPLPSPLTSSWGGPWVPESAAPRGSLYTAGTTPGPCPPRGTRDSLWGPGPTPWPCPRRRGARGADAAPARLGLPLGASRWPTRTQCRWVPWPGSVLPEAWMQELSFWTSLLVSLPAAPPCTARLPHPAPHGRPRLQHCSSAGPGRARRGPRAAHLLRHRLMTLQTMSLEKCCLAIPGSDAIRFLTV